MADFTSFTLVFEGDIVTPDDPDYITAITRWAKNAARPAKLVAFVKSPRDIALTLRYAKQAGLPIVVRGGGHSCAGQSSTSEGLVIDMSRYFGHVTIDRVRDKHPGLTGVEPDAMVATAGGGAIWKTVDERAIKAGYATVGGTVNHTGCGGLIVGGGYGWLMGRHGMTIDNLLKAYMVTADGSIVEASRDVNPDLFWGIKGGGSNFGVVTQFVLKIHPQAAKVFAGTVSYPPSSLPKVIDTMEKYRASKRGPDEAVVYVLTRGPDGPACYCVFFYNGPEDEGRKLFKEFFDIENLDDTTHMLPYERLNSLQNSFHEPGRCYYISGTTQAQPSPAIQLALNDYVQSAMQKYPHIQLAVVMDCFPLSKVLAVHPDESCFARNPHSNVVVQADWEEDKPENTSVARGMAKDLLEIIYQHNVGNPDVTATHEVGYSNYYNEDPSVPASGTDKAKVLFGAKYGKLAQLKKKYDPDMVFHKFFPIIPAA